ncbi:MAG: hypothetical protein LBO06_03415 [Bacteroidales bacterium]|jgi:cell division protein FtsZ|nr:hypothetical protein [Bacteroidales bacterium]
MTNYKIFTFGGAGEHIAMSLLQRDINKDCVFYFDTDPMSVEQSYSENKYCIGDLIFPAGCIEVAKEVFDAKYELFDSLTDDDSLYILVGAFVGATAGAFLLKTAELLTKKGKLFVAIGSLPFFFEGNRRYEIAVSVMEDLQKITSNIIPVPNDNVKKLFKNITLREALEKADYYTAEIITELLFLPEEKNKIISELLQKDSEISESILKIKNKCKK